MAERFDLQPAPGGWRGVWFVGAFVLLAALFAWHHWWLQEQGAFLQQAKISYGIGFGVLTVLLMGAFSRLPLSDYLMVWRMAAFLLASLTAVLEVGLHHYPQGWGVLLWASAEVGVSAVILAARFLPAAILMRWLHLQFAPPAPAAESRR